MKSKLVSELQDSFDGYLEMAGYEFYPGALRRADEFSGSAMRAQRHDGAAGHDAVDLLAGTPVKMEETFISSSAASTAGTSPDSTVAVTSGGITINLLFDAAAMAAPASFRAGIQQAVSLLTAAISDQITVNIKIDYSGTGGGAAAGPDNGLYETYSSVNANLISHATGGDTTFNALPSGASVQGQADVAVWNAQLKLWGVLGANDTTTDDGGATFATDINPGLLVGVALHELTHALGRVPYGSPTDTSPDIFDLFRYTSPGVRLFAGGNTAPAAYFSLDGGNTKLADFGRNSDPSDFLNSGVQGPNDPFNEFYTSSTSQTLTSVDKAMLDALGFHTMAPVNGIVVAGNPVEAVQGGSAVALLYRAPTITDSGFATLTGATVKIANGIGSAVAGDQLYVNGVQNGAVGSGVTASWNAGTGTLTLTGSATLAVYQTLLGAVSYADTGVDGSSGGHPARVVSWSVNDGTNSYSTTSSMTIDRLPVATNDAAIAAAGQTFIATAATGVFSNDTDLDGDTLRVTGLSDVANGSGSVGSALAGIYGHLTFNADGSYSYAADNLSAINAVPAGSHPIDNFTYTESDGNGGAATATLAITVVRPPAVTASTVTAGTPGQVFAATSLFSATDPGGYAITHYYFYDKTPGSGYWALNGVAQPSNQVLKITPAELPQMTFHSATTGGDDLLVCADNPYSESRWTEFYVNAPVISPPVVTASTVTAGTPGQVFAATSLFSATDPGGNAITEYYFYDKTAGSGYWALNGIAQPSNQVLKVDPAQLSQVTFHSATTGGDDLLVCADNPYSESRWTEFYVNAPVISPPVVTASTVTAGVPGQVLAATSLFSATDPGGYAITEYYFYDKTAGSGYWALNGIAQPSNQVLKVDPAQLSQVTFHSATTGGDDLLVCADNPYSESRWTEFYVNAPVISPPVVTANTVTATTPGQVFSATSLFSATDPGGYPITHYYFYDKTPGGGYWALNGVAEPSNQVLKITPAELSQMTFHTATTGGDDLLVCADNPYNESRWTEFYVNAPASTAPASTESVVASGTATDSPAQDLAQGMVSFSATDSASTHTVSVLPVNQDTAYAGNFGVDALKMANTQATVGWHFNLDANPVAQPITQSYQVTMTEAHADGTSTAASQMVSVTIGGPDNNSFVFHPGMGADVVVNSHSTDTIELNGFASIPNSNTLAALLQEAQSGQAQSTFVAVNGGHDTLIVLDSHDSLTLTNVRIADLHASGFIVH
jgi:VCBS repeat-containing protein